MGDGNSDDAAAKAVKALQAACDDAYAKFANSCSHAVWHVLKTIVNAETTWLDANHLIENMIASSEWKAVSLDEGWQLAQRGIVVVGGLKTTPNGHVIVIYPGSKIPSGGYPYTYKDKKTGASRVEKLRSHGIYPRALSTSMGTWPGAKSKGDKTVWDPWASDDSFGNVKFWART